MSDHAKVAGPREQRRKRIIIWMVAISAAAGLGLGTLSGYGAVEPVSLISANPWLVPAAIVLGLAGLVALCLWYWRAIDELARQAHLEAWFWGGSIGMTAALLWFAFAPQMPSAWSFGLLDLPATEALFYGAFATMFAAIAGYGLAWAVFWLRRR